MWSACGYGFRGGFGVWFCSLGELFFYRFLGFYFWISNWSVYVKYGMMGMAYGEDSGQRLSTSLFLPIWSERWRLLGVVRMHLASGRGGRSET